jgi:hypothetical protein
MNEKITAEKLVKAFGKDGALNYSQNKVKHFSTFRAVGNESQTATWKKICEIIESK